MEITKNLEELFLCPLFVGQEVYVVDHQDIDRAVALAEQRHAVETDRVDQLVDKLLSRQISHTQLRLILLELMTDSVEEMSFAKADAGMENERVVRERWA